MLLLQLFYIIAIKTKQISIKTWQFKFISPVNICNPLKSLLLVTKHFTFTKSITYMRVTKCNRDLKNTRVHKIHIALTS